MNCETCKYWDKTDETGPAPFFEPSTGGYCHRNPPAVLNIPGMMPLSKWPKTEPADWCGNYEEARYPSTMPLAGMNTRLITPTEHKLTKSAV